MVGNIPKQILDTRVFGSRLDYFKFIASQAPSGDWAEFGVFKGVSARQLLQLLPKTSHFHLFDSWEGLPEDWDAKHPKGHFKCPIPKFKDKRVLIYKGFFEDTLPAWSPKPLGLVHIDSDLYSSCVTVLERIRELLVPNAIIMFDEFINYHRWDKDEYKAFHEWVAKHEISFEYIARTKKHQVAVRVR